MLYCINHHRRQETPSMRPRSTPPVVTALAALSTLAVAEPTPPAERLEEVKITATPLRRSELQTAQPVLVLAGDELLRRRAGNIADTLASEPGLSASSFGPIASRPVIRGQGGLRVQVFQDGADVLDAAALSEDHAVSLDALLAERIEVVRGPAALLFGNAASAGAVNVVTRRLPTEPLDKPFAAALELRGDSAADARAVGAHATGRIGDRLQVYADLHDSRRDELRIPGYAWTEAAKEYFESEGEAYDESRDRLANSDGSADGGSLGIAWVGDRQRYGFSVSEYGSEYGLPGLGHGHDHDHDHDHEHGFEPPDVRLDMTQRRYDASAEWLPSSGAVDALRLRIARNDYEHAEIEGDGEVGTLYAQVGDEVRLTADHRVGEGRGVFGVQWRELDFDAVGEEAFLPPSMTRNTGVFAFQEHRVGAVTIEAGARYEKQRIATADPDTMPDYEGNALSGSVGALWGLRPGATLALQLTRTERHPTATELFASGPHLAVQRYEIGDADLGTERGLTADLSLRFAGDAGWRGTVGVFHSDYDRYIVAQPSGDTEDGLPVVEFMARDARFTGAEFEVGHDALAATGVGAVGLRLFGDLVRAEDGAGEPLPQIPPLRLGAEASLTGARLRLGIEAIWHDAQDRIADGERRTAGFTMLNLEASWRRPVGDSGLSLFLRGSNLLDEEARRHTSPLKDYAPLAGRAVSGGLRLTF
jgi:iron complex outermembrane receptor protein